MEFPLLIKAIVLGIIEGLTEFLPVSSTGHLIVAQDLLGFAGERAKVFAVFIQLGAILAVCWEYRARFLKVASGLGSDPAARRFAINLLVAFAPAVVLGVAFHKTIKTYLFSPVTVAGALVAGALVILWVERRNHRGRIASVDDMTWKDALKVGLAQTVAMFPGVSRSGATIVGGMLFGLTREAATLFSFFLAVPTMLAAVTYDTYKSWSLLSVADLELFAAGFVTAFVTALLTVRALLAYVSRHNFRPFAWYRLFFGGIVLLTWWTGWVDWSEPF
ncbi:undecaprenyl-diphosphate phosphatase [Pelomicrobium methylotrophicum]|uniref:Undecaprenyl-diphosphatase n=1 Tax=Pelomicrobium methylotrophicum TaxID=2602750 RepID=A0A5C7EPF4_9PROT|nr:undecaprenyl-diphosphate phosphatase [Pelomicrobium methylotrophicum]TXF13388.1 undecaprenyl-diphosphate phosphatase [Pelomicrobium methylotrophicum]